MAKKDCFCVLCSSKRKLRYSRRLEGKHYGQIFMLAFVASALLWPVLNAKSTLCLPVIWALFELIHTSLYRKDLKCTVCGFDPTWYKKDVKLARQKVEEFLKQNPESPVWARARLYGEISRNDQN